MGILVKVVKSKYLKVELQSELDFLKKKQNELWVVFNSKPYQVTVGLLLNKAKRKLFKVK